MDCLRQADMSDMTSYGPRCALKVAALIDPLSNQWDWHAIRNILPSYEDAIRLLPRSSHRRRDKLTWLPNKKGVYTTKSGYGLLTVNDVPDAQRNFN